MPAASTPLPKSTGTKVKISDLNASDQADFSPFYRCLHIYDVLVRGFFLLAGIAIIGIFANSFNQKELPW